MPVKIKALGKIICGFISSTYNDYASCLNNYKRMCDADNRILSVSSGGFHRAFKDVAKHISYTKVNKYVDTYCVLAEKAVDMLASGTSEADTLSYFDEILMKEKGKV